ncbi:serine/threonine-protein kinase gin4 [Thecaphora frezii]
MTSSYRSTVVQPIPPFKGGPLQATDVQNRKTAAADSNAAYAKKPSAASSGARSAAPSQRHGATYAPSERKQAERREGGERPKPVSRLEREKKRHHNDPKNIGPWKLDKLIGQGASGRVRLATHSVTGQQAAVKIIPRTLINQSRMSLRDADAKTSKMILGIEREIVIMKLIEHPNLLGLWDVYETSKELYLIMEYVAGGELFDHLVAQGRLQPREARSYFRQIIFGMDYCHRFNICHRDLKPENLLLDATKRIVKVADFGMAALQPTEKMLETSCGSPHYASPEIVSGKRYKGSASDIWSCGIILFALLCGRLPFDDPNIQQLLAKVRAGKFIMPEWLEPASKDLIWRMLEVDPEKRITMYEIMRHPWFTNNGAESDRNPVTTSFESFENETVRLEDIDMDILGNLKTLWSELSEEDIVRQLLASGPNWQKTFYTLLVAHRENHSADDDEAYDEDADQEQRSGASSSLLSASNAKNQPREKARPRRSLDTSGSGSNPASPRLPEFALRASNEKAAPTSPSPAAAPRSRPGSAMGQRSAVADVSKRATATIVTGTATGTATATTSSPRATTATGAVSPSPARPLPSPNKARAEALPPKLVLQNTVATTTPKKSSASGESPRTTLQRRATSPRQQSKSGRSALVDEDDQLETTPVRLRVGRSMASEMTPRPGPRASSRPVSPSKPGSSQSRPANLFPTQPLPAAIQIPQVGDATMQRFFQEIADELASIRASGERPDALQSKIAKLQESINATARNAPSRPETVASLEAIHHSDLTQFEDAEDDVSEGESLQSMPDTPYTPSTPMTPISPPMRAAPLAVADKIAAAAAITRHPAPLESANTARSVRSARTPGSIGSNSRPASIFSTGSSGAGSMLGRKRSLLIRSKEYKVDDQVQLDGRNTIAYEQTRPGVAPSTAPSSAAATPQIDNDGFAVPQSKGPTRLQQRKNPGLGLDIGTSNAYVAGTGTAVSSPVMVSMPATPSMTPKNSWFAGLFNWKPATHTLLSTENFSETLVETSRLLQSYGVRVVVEDADHHGMLKCTVNEYREFNGVVTAAKPVRFRVEFTILPVGSAANSPHLGLGLALPSPAMGSSRSGHPSPALSTFSRLSGASGAADFAQRPTYGFATSVTLIQEKGALSTFKLIHARLRREWSLDQSATVAAIV